jgi:amino acid adenylation domain-containing protein
VIWGWLLTQQTQSSDVLFGTVVSGRPETIAGIDRAVGLFINTRPIRFLTEGCHTVGELLKRVTQDAVASRPHESLTLAEIQSLSALPSDQPIFDSLLVFENYPMDERFRGEGAEGVQASSWQIGKIRSNESTEYPLTLVIEPSQRGTQCLLQYDPEKYSQSQIECLLQQMHHITQQIVLDKLEKLDMLTSVRPEAQRWLVDNWNATACEFPRGTHLHTLVRHQVEARPDAIAIVDASGALTYEALWAESVRLAAAVQAHEHFVVGEAVALWLPRDRSAVIGMLAVLLAGAHYVPLDPIYPQNRLAFIVRDSGAFAVITSVDMDSIGWEVPQINVSDEVPEANLVTWSVDPASHPAYVIYTSGSTGTPKGCVISHQNTVRLFANDEMEFDFNDSDIWVAAHSLCFDFSVWEIFGALTTGGRVVIPAYEDVRNVDRFLSVVVDSSVTVLNQTPEAFYRFSDLVVSKPSADLSHLRCVIFGGDTLDPCRLKPFVDRMATHSIQMVNMYGITETTVHVTYGPLDVQCLSETAYQPGSFVGRPLPETTIWVVNESGQLVPPGTVGEIVVGGSGVSLGYRNRPDLTAEKFRPLAVAGEPRCYWSGDLGVILPERGLVHLGRKDRQVQIRGFRVECGEIMTALTSHQSVSQAYVTSFDSREGPELIAYLVGDEAAAPARWSAYFEPLLPRYMHPSYYCWLPEIPLTANGKVDAANLPTPQDTFETPDVIDDDTFLQTILESWKSVLGHSGIASDSEFFEVGGHSLKALALAEHLSDDLGVSFDVTDIFDYTTPKQQATHAESLRVSAESLSAVDELLSGLDDDEIAATLALMSDDA